MSGLPKVKETVVPYPLLQIKITVLSNDSINVKGFPSNLGYALSIFNSAQLAVVNHFIVEASNGNLDENNTKINIKSLNKKSV